MVVPDDARRQGPRSRIGTLYPWRQVARRGRWHSPSSRCCAMNPTDEARTTPMDASGCVVLDRAQCLRYLAGGGLGRIAVNVGALPAILPVHFALDGEHVVFSIGAGTTLDRATRDAVVAFE